MHGRKELQQQQLFQQQVFYASPDICRRSPPRSVGVMLNPQRGGLMNRYPTDLGIQNWCFIQITSRQVFGAASKRGIICVIFHMARFSLLFHADYIE